MLATWQETLPRYLLTIILHIQMSFTLYSETKQTLADEAIITLKNLVLILLFTSHHNL